MEDKKKTNHNYENNSFANFYLKEVCLYIQLLFLDLIYDLKPKITDYWVNALEIYDINASESIYDSENKCIFKQIIKKEKKLFIALKKKIHDPCCFYQYFNIKLYFINSKGKSMNITYMIPLYYNQKNYVYSLYYNCGYKSYEIIIRKNTFDPDEYLNIEPTLDFIVENKCQKISSEESFEENPCLKRFLFINIYTYESFPNLNLRKYEYFKYHTGDHIPSHITIYLDEDFDHIGFYYFNINTLRENIINFSLLDELYNNCLHIEKVVLKIKESFTKGNFQFYSQYKKLIDNTIKFLYINNNMIENCYLFIRQNIENLKEKGKDLIFYFSYYILIRKLEKNIDYFDKIIAMFESFQKSLKNIFKLKTKKSELDEIKLIFTVSSLLSNFLDDDNRKCLENFEIKELLNIIQIIDFTDKTNIYSFVENNNYDIIDNLNNNSYLFYILNQFNSSIGKNMIKANFYSSGNSNCSMLSMITLQNIKEEFKLIKQRWGLKIGFKTDFRAVTNILTKITCYNEINLFGDFKKERSIHNDQNYYQRMILSMNMKHERFCHTLLSINIFTGNIVGSPREYLDFEEKSKIELVSKGKKESGNAFEYLITRDIDFIQFLRNPPKIYNYERFFNNQIWISNTMYYLYIEYKKLLNTKIVYIKKNSKVLKKEVKDKSNLNISKKDKISDDNDDSDDSDDIISKTLRICKNDYCDIFAKKDKYIRKKNFY